MKKILSVVGVLACLNLAASAEMRVGPFLSAMVATGDDSGEAFGGGGKFEWLSSINLGADARVGYLNDGDIGLVPLMLGPTYVVPIQDVALTLGAGFIYGIPTDNDYDSAPGFYLSAGVRGRISDDMEWFAELQYVDVQGDDNEKTTYYPWGYSYEWNKIDFTGIALHAGVLWKL